MWLHVYIYYVIIIYKQPLLCHQIIEYSFVAKSFRAKFSLWKRPIVWKCAINISFLWNVACFTLSLKIQSNFEKNIVHCVPSKKDFTIDVLYNSLNKKSYLCIKSDWRFAEKILDLNANLKQARTDLYWATMMFRWRILH